MEASENFADLACRHNRCTSSGFIVQYPALWSEMDKQKTNMFSAYYSARMLAGTPLQALEDALNAHGDAVYKSPPLNESDFEKATYNTHADVLTQAIKVYEDLRGSGTFKRYPPPPSTIQEILFCLPHLLIMVAISGLYYYFFRNMMRSTFDLVVTLLFFGPAVWLVSVTVGYKLIEEWFLPKE